MIKNKKSFLQGFSLCLTLVIALLLASTVIKYQNQNPTIKDNVFIVMETAHGKTVLSSHNVITDIGENRTAAYHWNLTTANLVNYISVGNATAGTGLTQLTTQYDRFLGTVANWTNGGDYAFNVTYTHQFNETQSIDCVGAHWASSGDNNLYAVANFVGGATVFNDNDNLTAIWVFTYDAN